ncbi:OmpA family protein [Aliarcobacter lanthieri]|uniref:OmpA family protein n=1 Tax=Aliarcobacter lanthieri TaxID=1355374 RepID=UPI00047BD3EE|nr:OmpA family protein [Aliarcobacter lanthieri]QKF59019.1 OmpA domain lipoprotein [Aliarcobacter lanthieri]
MDDLNKLKALLLKEELETLQKINIQIQDLNYEVNNQDIIVEKISPLISQILEKNYTSDKNLLDKALSPLVESLIDRNFEQSKDKVVSQMAPIITTAIGKSIKSHKNEVVDTLYPVVGNMISKYVSKTFEEMIESINYQVKQALTFKSITRKIKAKFQGVSEAELLLKDSAIANIKAVFFIHKETGIVLANVQRDENKINEPEMVASMLTAIRSFINDWVDKNDKHHEVNTIEYGGSKIVLETTGHSYLAVIVDGVVSKETIKTIQNILGKLVSKYGNKIRDFDGNLSNLPINKFEDIIKTLINNNTNIKKEKESIHPLLYIVPILFFSWIGYLIYNSIIDSNIEKKANEILYKNPELTIYRLEANVKNRDIFINGVVPNSFYKDIAYNSLKNLENISNLENNIQVIDYINNPKDIYDKITYLRMALNQKDGNKIEYTYDYPTLKVTGSVISKNEKKYVESQFALVEGLEKLEFDIKIVPPEITDVIHFDLNSAEILPNQEYKLINIINLLHKLDDDLVLEVYGFRDYTGSVARNEILVNQRATNVMKYLKVKGNVSQKLVNLGRNEIPEGIEEEYFEQGRRVIFKWKEK